jgi:DNA-binding response OmpR family regulator
MLPRRQEIASVVVCEDDTVTLELLCDHLVADRFGALPAPSASDALRLCRYNQPDLLLLDLSLPDASGLDVLREIREADGVGSRFDPRLPVIVLTGRGADADRVRGLESGADDYLTKPSARLFTALSSGFLASTGRNSSSNPLIACQLGSGSIQRIPS